MGLPFYCASFGAALAFSLLSSSALAAWPESAAQGITITQFSVSAETVIQADGKGGVYNAYVEAADGGTALKVAYLDKFGERLWGDAGVTVRTGTSKALKSIQLLTDTDGVLWVHWVEQENFTNQLFVQAIREDGTAILAQNGRACGALDESDGYKVIAGAEGGCIQAIATEQAITLVQNLPSGGTGWVSVLIGSLSEYSLEIEDLVADGNGGGYLAYSKYSLDIFGNHKDLFVSSFDNKVTLSDEVAVAADADHYEHNLSLVRLGDVGLFCVYEDLELGNPILALLLSSNLQPLGAPGLLTPLGADSRQVIKTTSGDIVVAYSLPTLEKEMTSRIYGFKIGGGDPAGTWPNRFLGTTTGGFEIAPSPNNGFYFLSTPDKNLTISKFDDYGSLLWDNWLIGEAGAMFSKVMLPYSKPALAPGINGGLYVNMAGVADNVRIMLTHIRNDGSIGGEKLPDPVNPDPVTPDPPSPPQLPDLAVWNSDAILTGKKNSGKMYGSVSVKNIGSGPSAPTQFHVTISSSVPGEPTILLRTLDVPALLPGQEFVMTPGYQPVPPPPPVKPGKKPKKPKKPKQIKFKLPKKYNIPGKNFSLTVDPANIVAESYEGNNSFTFQLH